MPRRAQQGGRAVLGLSYGRPGACRSAARAPPCAGGGGGRRREIPHDELAVPDVGGEGGRRQAGIDFGRTYPRVVAGDRSLRGPDRGLFGPTTGGGTGLTTALPLAAILVNLQ